MWAGCSHKALVVKMKTSYAIVLESDKENSLITMIEFNGSYYQAMRVFDSLMYALVDSSFTALKLFRKETQIKTLNFKR